MNSKNIFCLVTAILIGFTQYSCAGVKILSEAKAIEGKIVISCQELKKDGKYSALYILKEATLKQIPNTEMLGDIRSLHWSLNGKQIVFYGYLGASSEEIDEKSGIYIINEDGSNLKRIRKGFNSIFNFTSEGEQIIFQVFPFEKDREAGFYILNIDGTGLRKLGSEEAEQYSKSTRWPDIYNRFSPDGKKRITYKSASETVTCNEIYITDNDKDLTEKITRKNFFQFNNDYGVWSSDSKKIMYLWTSVMERQAIRLYNLESKTTADILIRKGNRDIKGFDWWTPPVK